MERQNVVQEKSYSVAKRIVELVREFPRRMDGFVLGNQLLRSGTSIGANIEEAIAAFSREDFAYKMNTALKEAREAHYWLRLARDTGLTDSVRVASLLGEVEEVMRILGAIVRSAKKKWFLIFHSYFLIALLELT